MKFIEEKVNGAGIRTYSFTANAEEWRLVKGMAERLKRELPDKVLAIMPIRARLTNIINEIGRNIPYPNRKSWKLEDIENK